MSRDFLFLLLVLAVGALGACATRAAEPYRARYGPPSQAVPGIGTRQCSYLEPDRLGSVEEMTRVNLRGNLALWGADGDPADSVVVSIRYDEEGELEWVRPIHSTLSGDRVQSLERLLRSSVQEQGPPEWGFRFRVAGDGRGADVRPSVLCPVRIERFDASTGRVFGTSQEMAEASRVRGRRFQVEVSVDAMGRVTDVRLPQSSGSRAVDQGAIDVVRTASFHPQLHDGFGVPSVYMFPLRYGRRY